MRHKELLSVVRSCKLRPKHVLHHLRYARSPFPYGIHLCCCCVRVCQIEARRKLQRMRWEERALAGRKQPMSSVLIIDCHAYRVLSHWLQSLAAVLCVALRFSCRHLALAYVHPFKIFQGHRFHYFDGRVTGGLNCVPLNAHAYLPVLAFASCVRAMAVHKMRASIAAGLWDRTKD